MNQPTPPQQPGQNPQFAAYPPQMQQPPKKKSIFKKWWFWLIAVIVVIGIASQSGGGSTGSATDGGSASGGSAAKKDDAVGLNTAVKDDDIEFTVTGFKCGVTVKTYQQLTPQGQFCQLDLSAKNVGSKQVMLSSTGIKLLDDKGAEYQPSSETIGVEESLFIKAINPGNTMTGKVYVDVPTDVQPTRAVLQGGLFSKGAKVNLS